MKKKPRQKKNEDGDSSRNRPVSLQPLGFEEAVEGLLNTPPKKQEESKSGKKK